MAKKLLAAFTAVGMALALLLGASITAAAEYYYSVLVDLADVLTDDEEDKLLQYLNDTAQLAECNVGVIITNNIHGQTARAYTEDKFDSTFGKDSDGVMLLINNDYDSGYGDWLTAEGNAVERFGKKSDAVLQAMYDGLNSGGFYGAVKGFCDYLRPDGGESVSYHAVLNDLDGVLTTSEKDELCALMLNTANEIEVNIGVVITNDLQGKSDEAYTNDFLDSSFGFGSSSIVLLFNNDRSNMDYVDWISTCGKGSDWYDRKIDRIFDRVYDGLGDDDYCDGIRSFCSALKTYAGSGSSTLVDSPVTDFRDNAESFGTIIRFLMFPIAISLVIAIVITCCVASTYKRKKPVSASHYMDKSRTRFIHKSDTFIREFHTSRRVSSSSSGGGGGRHSGGGGHHSSSHSSHGGGGGRRR